MTPSHTTDRKRSLERDTYFEIVNEVLVALGRDRLPARGPQRAVIEVRPSDRVLQILAGPGSGKTEMLVWRVLFELLVNMVPADQVVVTTFTRRAATELQVRVVERCDEFLKACNSRGIQIGDPQVHNLRIGTIHGLCDSLLTEFDSAYLEAGTRLIDEVETALRIARSHRYALGFTGSYPKRLLDRLLDQREFVALFRAAWGEENWPANLMERIDFICSVLDQHLETWIPRCSSGNVPNGVERTHGPQGLTGELVKLQGRWERYLDENHILDFATVQKRFFERQQMLIGRFRHVFVDEFQDSNPIQFAIHTRWLLNPATKLTVVGDDDQAIYRFRGSDIQCFRDLESHCKNVSISYRTETLGVNYRSTRLIVDFSQKFKLSTVLKQLSLSKTITAAPGARSGAPVRLLRGPWDDICSVVAEELDGLGVGRLPKQGQQPPPSAAVLIFSTSEKQGRSWTAPGFVLRTAIEKRGLRVYNPRNKTAGSSESPVAMLLGLISYLIDPVSIAPAGKGGRSIMVWASKGDPSAQMARSVAPTFRINTDHVSFQKKFIKSDGGDIGRPPRTRKPVLDFVDRIRDELSKVPVGQTGRLTLAGFVARTLSLPFFRNTGFDTKLFRQALFTQLLEANIAPTRLSMQSLDQPLQVTKKAGKYEWPERFWNFLNYFGAYLSNNSIDDPDVEAFEEDAVLMITFHQAKGLEFDHVYVAGTGRQPDIAPALRTRLFSGQAIQFSVSGSELRTKDSQTIDLSMADREREVYVAITRAKKSLTILDDRANKTPFMALNPAIDRILSQGKKSKHPAAASVSVLEFV